MVIYSHNWEQEYSSTTVSLDQKTCNSDEEVLLASSCPKKRAGRKKFKETRHPVYRGVRRRNNNRWVCEVRAPNNKTRIWLGTYPTAEMAARAHDVAVLALRGRMACLNFADSATRLRIPASGDIRDIQRVAAEAAEEFRPERESAQENTKEYEEIMQENSSEVTEVGYMDEEATFHMPKLLTHMAEGMLVSPPHHTVFQGFGWDDTEGESEVSLWSYSI